MYPIIANCYEQTHALRQAARDNNCPDELQALESVLEEELDENGEFERGMLSEQAIDEAEAAVYAALATTTEELPCAWCNGTGEADQPEDDDSKPDKCSHCNGSGLTDMSDESYS